MKNIKSVLKNVGHLLSGIIKLLVGFQFMPLAPLINGIIAYLLHIPVFVIIPACIIHGIVTLALAIDSSVECYISDIKEGNYFKKFDFDELKGGLKSLLKQKQFTQDIIKTNDMKNDYTNTNVNNDNLLVKKDNSKKLEYLKNIKDILEEYNDNKETLINNQTITDIEENKHDDKKLNIHL